jgi:hypothetical protein
MNQVRLPVFVRLKDCGDVVRYDAIEKLQSHFEQIDVENEEYEAWDATGTRLDLSVQESDEWLRIDPVPNPQPEQLAEAINEFARLQGVGVDVSLLRAGDFSGALKQITSAIQSKRQSRSWWQRFKRRF